MTRSAFLKSGRCRAFGNDLSKRSHIAGHSASFVNVRMPFWISSYRRIASSSQRSAGKAVEGTPKYNATFRSKMTGRASQQLTGRVAVPYGLLFASPSSKRFTAHRHHFRCGQSSFNGSDDTPYQYPTSSALVSNDADCFFDECQSEFNPLERGPGLTPVPVHS